MLPRNNKGQFIKGYHYNPKTEFKKGSGGFMGEFTAEHRKKISETLKRKGIRPPSRKGIKATEATRKKLSAIRKGIKKSIEWRRKIGMAQMNEKNHNWKGGRQTPEQKIRNSFDYKLWRTAVLERDKYKCVFCGSIINLEVDHIKPFRDYPELRFAIDNGRTLCRSCHKKTGRPCNYEK